MEAHAEGNYITKLSLKIIFFSYLRVFISSFYYNFPACHLVKLLKRMPVECIDSGGLNVVLGEFLRRHPHIEPLFYFPIKYFKHFFHIFSITGSLSRSCSTFMFLVLNTSAFSYHSKTELTLKQQKT